jgi:hypothetical protein
MSIGVGIWDQRRIQGQFSGGFWGNSFVTESSFSPSPNGPAFRCSIIYETDITSWRVTTTWHATTTWRATTT